MESKLKKAWHQCETKLLELSVMPSTDGHEFCKALAQQRGREIRLVDMDIQAWKPGVYGLWLRFPSVDYILYERNTSSAHQNHIILHEAGHVVFGHEPTSAPGSELPAGVFDALPLELILSVLQRSVYSSQAELEAEIFAMVVEDGAGAAPSELDLDSSPGARGLLYRIEASLEERYVG